MFRLARTARRQKIVREPATVLINSRNAHPAKSVEAFIQSTGEGDTLPRVIIESGSPHRHAKQCNVDRLGPLRYGGQPVAITRKNGLLALCLGTVLIFFAQSMLCFAQEIGALPCCDQAEQTESPDGGHKHDSAPSSGCGGCVCFHGTVMPGEDPAFSSGSSVAVVSLRPDETAPDGPVYEIEYPPQLS